MGDLIECPDGLDEDGLREMSTDQLRRLFNGMVKEYYKQCNVAVRLIPFIGTTQGYWTRRNLLRPLRLKLNYVSRLLNRRLPLGAMRVNAGHHYPNP